MPDTDMDMELEVVTAGRFVTKLLPVALEDRVVVGLVTTGPGAMTTGPVVVGAEAVKDVVAVVGMLAVAEVVAGAAPPPTPEAGCWALTTVKKLP